ncbi:MAG: SDR family NAD(P)-dependent oxidoreductase [Spirochaetaceae bacterium]|nr:SDR family NAD(P)-dependent oxidoreductase [Myxococcales bacterium]MCB9725663.1 SDR family NAD(P)-dependent oxidoreductase [Spirochaetaceae bacterium]HPG24238.1 SDR family NAD(P)-dependent oxidoreductase [Myxococcota bacterium]
MAAERPLAGKVAIVTGASRGIGRGCAVELGARGATVYCTGRRTSDATPPTKGTVEAVAAEIDAAGGRGIAVACDHRDDAAVEALFARVQAEQGRLDVLVNNAFIIPDELTSGRPFWELPLSNWDDMIDVGTRSAYAASRLAVPIMIEGGGGLIANISSSGAAEYAWHVAYGVGKAALDRFTADAAIELREQGVAVVSLWPGLVLTERNERASRHIPGLDFSQAESLRFTGRAVAALACDPKVMEKSGRALISRELADEYGFTDVDGRLPAGPLHRRPKGAEAARAD